MRYRKICITNRRLAAGSLPDQIRLAVKNGADAVILREKDLPEPEYKALAIQVIGTLAPYGVPCILHSFVQTATELQHPYIHLPMPQFLALSERERRYFRVLGVSTHTVEEAVRAKQLGATCITASHIFPTDCKPGLAPRGLDYLRTVCEAAGEMPVYALGGIHPENISACIEAGAAGVCMMSDFMKL